MALIPLRASSSQVRPTTAGSTKKKAQHEHIPDRYLVLFDQDTQTKLKAQVQNMNPASKCSSSQSPTPKPRDPSVGHLGSSGQGIGRGPNGEKLYIGQRGPYTQAKREAKERLDEVRYGRWNPEASV